MSDVNLPPDLHSAIKNASQHECAKHNPSLEYWDDREAFVCGARWLYNELLKRGECKPVVKLKKPFISGKSLIGIIEEHPVLGREQREVRTSNILKVETRNTIYEIDWEDSK